MLLNLFKKIISVLCPVKRISYQDPPLLGATICGKRENLIIGDKVSFGGNVVLYANNLITIGEYTMIGMNTILHTSTHDYNMHPMWRYRIDKPISIGKHVWIGTSCVILAGVIIEDYAVVAAGSVVTANVPQGAIVGGNPARIIKYRDPSVYRGKLSIELLSEALPLKKGHIEKMCKGR